MKKKDPSRLSSGAFPPTCPPVSPSAPTALPSSRITRSTRSGEVPVVARATCSKAKESRASPARMAMSSPYTCCLFQSFHLCHPSFRASTLSSDHAPPIHGSEHASLLALQSPERRTPLLTLWLVGRPLRKSSLSMEGKSSWIRLMVCTTSMAQAVGIAHAMSPAQKQGSDKEYVAMDQAQGVHHLHAQAMATVHAMSPAQKQCASQKVRQDLTAAAVAASKSDCRSMCALNTHLRLIHRQPKSGPGARACHQLEANTCA
eukprot:1151053-Pelagomonas_calceolata.AAC.2